MLGENKTTYYSIGDLINILQSFLHHLKKKWLYLIIATFLGAGLGAFIYYKQKPKYDAVTTFILEEKSAGGGGLAGLASQFGLNIGGLSGGGSIFTGDNILSILKSKKVVQQVLLNKIDSDLSNGKTLADLYLEFTGVKESWKNKQTLSKLSFAGTNNMISPLQDSVLNLIYESIIKENLSTDRISKQGTIIKVQVTSADALFSRLMTERLIDEASRLYLNIRIGTAQENIHQLQKRSDSLLLLLNNKSYRAAASQPLDINPGIRTANVPVEIVNRDKTVLATLYAEVTKNLEASKLILSQQTPIIQLLDRPSYLLSDNKKSLPLLMSFSAIGAGFFCFIGIVLSYIIKRASGKQVDQ